MYKGLIQLCYRKIIDISSHKAWERSIFEKTYLQYFMNSSFYNPQDKHRTFQEILAHNPQAEQLHAIVGTEIEVYLTELKDQIPDIHNALGNTCLPFEDYSFEVIDSNNNNKEEHQITIYFYSELLTWIDTIDTHLLIAYGDQREALEQGEEVATDMIPLHKMLSISSFQKY